MQWVSPKVWNSIFSPKSKMIGRDFYFGSISTQSFFFCLPTSTFLFWKKKFQNKNFQNSLKKEKLKE